MPVRTTEPVRSRVQTAATRGHVRLTRPSTCGASIATRRNFSLGSRNRRDTDPGPGIRDSGERLEYEWPDLPPLDQITNAITRRRVSMGLNYVLPVAKTKNSVENVYRTNLRMMFKEPYLSNTGPYNEDKLHGSINHHLKTNTVPSTYSEPRPDYTRYTLNHESDKVRRNYAHSAPPHGLTGKNITPQSKELRPKSKLYLPIKTRPTPETIKLKKEAERILKSVQKDPDEYDPNEEIDLADLIGARIEDVATKRTASKETKSYIKVGSTIVHKPFFKKTDKYKDYEELRKAKVSDKPEFPESLKSPYLSQDKNMHVWNWLNKDEVVTEFSHFMSICS